LSQPDLASELGSLDPETARALKHWGFDPDRLLGWAERLLPGDGDANRVRGEVAPPQPQDISPLPERTSVEGRRLELLGLEAIRRGELAVVVLAGGMATRMGGVVKALVDIVPGLTFMDARLAERDHWSAVANAPLPLVLMTSYATDEPIREALGDTLDGRRVDAFTQGVSLRLTPDGHVFRTANGEPSLHATGHGDLPDSIRSAGTLGRLVDEGVRVVWIANLDNLGAAIDPLVLGAHLDGGSPLTVEVVDKQPGDRGGTPFRVDGRPVILESFRVPHGVDEDDVSVFNTNTFLVDAERLRDLDMDWTWFRVEKSVGGRPAIQFERLIGELTSALDSAYLLVPREGPESRFLPAKDHDELDANRAAIEARVAPYLTSVEQQRHGP
jgi:UTP--glucose-1-phosphate uridylyltransferase